MHREEPDMFRVILLVMLVLGPTFAQAQVPAPDEAALKALLTEFLDGAGRNDATVHDRFWADDLVYTRSAGVRIDKAELMQGVRSAPPPKPEDPTSVFTGEDVRVQQYGDTAIVAFRLVATTTDGKTTEVSNYLNTGTFVKREGRWQVVAWQSTRVPDEAPEAPKP
jgi:uncharacterized protein (TIGR02246 family)